MGPDSVSLLDKGDRVKKQLDSSNPPAAPRGAFEGGFEGDRRCRSPSDELSVETEDPGLCRPRIEGGEGESGGWRRAGGVGQSGVVEGREKTAGVGGGGGGGVPFAQRTAPDQSICPTQQRLDILPIVRYLESSSFRTHRSISISRRRDLIHKENRLALEEKPWIDTLEFSLEA